MTSTMRSRLMPIRVSPRTMEPSSMRAARMAFTEVEGKTRPRISRTSPASWMARAKSPVISARAAMKRFPKLWPRSSPSERKRWSNSRDKSCSSSASATMQLRMSPGASILKSLRRRPLEPPSSVTATIAVKSEMNGAWGRTESLPRRDPCRTRCFRPLRRVDKPVPPPMETTRRPAGREFIDWPFFSILDSGCRVRSPRPSRCGQKSCPSRGSSHQSELGTWTVYPCFFNRQQYSLGDRWCQAFPLGESFGMNWTLPRLRSSER